MPNPQSIPPQRLELFRVPEETAELLDSLYDPRKAVKKMGAVCESCGDAGRPAWALISVGAAAVLLSTGQEIICEACGNVLAFWIAWGLA